MRRTLFVACALVYLTVFGLLFGTTHNLSRAQDHADDMLKTTAQMHQDIVEMNQDLDAIKVSIDAIVRMREQDAGDAR